jgi:hypothetical protein
MSSPVSRDRGLRRVSTATRWIAGGSLALTGAFAAVVARAVPGRAASTGSAATTVPVPATTTPSSTGGDGGSSATSSDDGGTSSGSATTLTPPTAPPTTAYQAPAQVSSGGS